MKRLNGARNDFMTEVVKMFRLMSRGRIWSKYKVVLLKLYLTIAKREGVRPMKRKRETSMKPLLGLKGYSVQSDAGT